MSVSVHSISLVELSYAFVPVIVALGILFYWKLATKNALYALLRMLIQLLLIGYLLTYIFAAEYAGVVSFVIFIMIAASSWIALGTVPKLRVTLYKHAFLAVGIGGGFTLAVMSQIVLGLEPWYHPQYMVPLAGMTFANSMNSISLSAERLSAELSRGVAFTRARAIALKASLIPVTNALFAVGLVSLPGMMTGQILSGVSPFIAVRYQIMVMCMLFASSVISAAIFLVLSRNIFTEYKNELSVSEPLSH